MGLAVAAVAWVVLLIVSPAWARATAGEGFHGRALAASMVRQIGARVCHQRPERSFIVHGRSMAVCGRCAGLYVSGTIGLLAAMPQRRRRLASAAAQAPVQSSTSAPKASGRVVFDARAGILALAAAPTLLTWATEVAGLWNPGTPLRALAALPLGLAAGWLIARSLDA